MNETKVCWKCWWLNLVIRFEGFRILFIHAFKFWTLKLQTSCSLKQTKTSTVFPITYQSFSIKNFHWKQKPITLGKMTVPQNYRCQSHKTQINNRSCHARKRKWKLLISVSFSSGFHGKLSLINISNRNRFSCQLEMKMILGSWEDTFMVFMKFHRFFERIRGRGWGISFKDDRGYVMIWEHLGIDKLECSFVYLLEWIIMSSCWMSFLWQFICKLFGFLCAEPSQY